MAIFERNLNGERNNAVRQHRLKRDSSKSKAHRNRGSRRCGQVVVRLDKQLCRVFFGIV